VFRLWIVPVLAFALAATVADAKAEGVRVLEDGDGSAVVGTDEFSLRIDRTGAIGRVMVGDTEQIWLIGLYTSPVSFETGETIRAVQGETSRGGLGPPPEKLEAQPRGDACTAVISRDCVREEIADGEPLYHLTQTVTVHPTGHIHLRYEFDWLRFFQMRHASLVIAARAAPLHGCPWWADFTSHLLHGTISADPGADSLADVKGDLRTFLAQCPGGELHLWFNDAGQVGVQRWNPDDYAFFIRVPKMGYRTEAYSGARSVIDVDIKLPLGRED